MLRNFAHNFFVCKRRQRGQVLLIVVLVMVVALTVGLSLASRSITNLRVSVEDQNSQKAFSAAEAGVEQALKTGTGSATVKSLGNNASIVQVDVTNISGSGDILINNGSVINQDDGADLWLSTYNSDVSKLYSDFWPAAGTGTLRFYWGSANDNCTSDVSTNTMAALEVFVISGTRGNPAIARYVFDPCSARANVNKFTVPGIVPPPPYTLNTSGGTKTFQFQTDPISVTKGLIVRVAPLYASTVIWAHGSTNFPSQGRIIASKGSAGSAQRKILYYQGFESVPSEFFYALLVPNTNPTPTP